MKDTDNPLHTPQSAAEWFAARRGPHDAQLERRFSQWLGEDSRNFEAYALCELTWELAAGAAEGIPVSSRTVPWYRRSVTAAAMLLIVIGLVLFGTLRLAPAPTTVWRTQAGEQRSLTLDDGSHVTLNTRSVVEVRLDRHTRRVRVVQGEAYFEVAHEPNRPFVVDTQLGSARAIGTRFNVLLDEQRVQVDTEEGRVLVTPAAAGASQVLTGAGVRATLTPGAMRPGLSAADLTRIENWRARRLEFDRTPLDAVLKEFSRYTLKPIRVESARLGATTITAVFKVGDVEALRATLRGAFGLQVIDAGSEWIVSAPRSDTP